ncbi:hypothetical protein FRC20_012008 [Serendipita sp. 405]|nr:hypothetical protein FRC20_012008 [Serendipita sp. 405]
MAQNEKRLSTGQSRMGASKIRPMSAGGVPTRSTLWLRYYFAASHLVSLFDIPSWLSVIEIRPFH